jgi:hypothetical protein
MPTNARPIVLKDAAGNLKQASQTDMEYLAYQAGRWHADVGQSYPTAIRKTTSTYTVPIGAFTNTFYEQPVGTHPASSLSVGSTTSFLYQIDGGGHIPTDDQSSGGFRRPVYDSDGGIYDYSNYPLDSNSRNLASELLSIIHGEEYLGSRRLGSTAPSADYTEVVSAVFEDTNTDSSVTTYNIYERTSQTAPTNKCNAMHIKRDAYGALPTGDYDGGLQAMSDSAMMVSFGTISGRFFSHGDVGTYELRSSAQGAPTATGTWEARGTAIDTRYTTESQQHNKQYTGFSEVQYSGGRSYSADYVSAPTQFAGTRQYSGDRTYAGDYVSPPIQFTGERSFSGSRNYSGDYVSAPTQFAGVRSFNGPRNFSNNYTSAPSQFAGVRNFSGPRNFSNQYTSAPTQFAGVRSFNGPRNFSNQYTRSPQQFAGVRNFSGPRNFSNQYTRSPQQFAGVRNFSGPRPSLRPGVVTQQFAGPRPTSYSRPVSYYRGANVNQNFTGTRNYSGVRQTFRPSVVTIQFNGNRNFNGPMPGLGFTGPRPANFTRPGGREAFFSRPAPQGPFTQTFFVAFPLPFGGGQTNVVTGYFSGVRNVQNFSGTRDLYFSGVRQWQFSGSRVWQFSGPRTFAGPQPIAYVANAPGNFASNPANFAGVRAVQYLGYTVSYRPGVLYQNFTGNRNVTYSGVVTQNFSRSQNFTGSRQYSGSRAATQNFARPQQFTGTRQFSGSRPSSQNFTRPQQFTGTRQFSGSRPSTQNFSRPQQFTGTRTFSGSRPATQNFTSPAQFTGTRTFSGSRNYATDYTTPGQFAGPAQFSGERTYSAQYPEPENFVGVRQFSGVRTYSTDYVGFYTNQYTGQYSGDTLIDTSETIETFTLYVRVS